MSAWREGFPDDMVAEEVLGVSSVLRVTDFLESFRLKSPAMGFMEDLRGAFCPDCEVASLASLPDALASASLAAFNAD